MKLRILTVGKLSNKQIRLICEDYFHRIGRFVSIEPLYVKQEKMASLSNGEILDRECDRILYKITARDHVIVLDKSGRQMSSEVFSEYFNKLAMGGIKEVTFIVGGPLGVDERVTSRADFVLSLSRMTFQHELATVTLLEQIYRAFSILRGEKYHK
jgi:23S rRNA (pseudouridine1915-N3)-methyltransferase